MPNNESMIFHGEIIDKKSAESLKFPIGTKFIYKNASYNDTFTVLGKKFDSGTEYRQIVGAINGETWLTLATLQGEAALGAITFPETKKIEESKPKAKKKSTKKASKKKASKSKGK